MATNNGHESAFSVAEVVGISAAAAAALGGVIVALGRAQANSQSQPELVKSLPSRKDVAKRAKRGRKFARSAAESASSHYPDARDRAAAATERAADAARVYGSEAAVRAEVGLHRAKHQGKALSEMFQESVLPVVTTGATKVRKSVAEQARNTDTDELLEKSRHFADEAGVQLRHAGESVSRTLQKDVLPVVTPVVKDATERAEELIEQIRDRAGDARKSNSSFPGAKAAASGKESAQNALHTTSQAATDSLSALMWLVVSSALVYLVLLSPERREQIKSTVYDGVEQIRLLIGDFKGYETEF